MFHLLKGSRLEARYECCAVVAWAALLCNRPWRGFRLAPPLARLWERLGSRAFGVSAHRCAAALAEDSVLRRFWRGSSYAVPLLARPQFGGRL